jgi:hypothetical protein
VNLKRKAARRRPFHCRSAVLNRPRLCALRTNLGRGQDPGHGSRGPLGMTMRHWITSQRSRTTCCSPDYGDYRPLVLPIPGPSDRPHDAGDHRGRSPTCRGLKAMPSARRWSASTTDGMRAAERDRASWWRRWRRSVPPRSTMVKAAFAISTLSTQPNRRRSSSRSPSVISSATRGADHRG